MAIRNIRKFGDDILRKKCRPIEKIDNALQTLIDDMIETLHKADGAGLAAPQIGILKRIAVIDVGNGPFEIINPEIVATEGVQKTPEGCLSIPGKCGIVERPMKVTVRATDRKGNLFEITGEDLLAKALCHEIDHLDGVLFVDKVTKYIEVDSE